jgi:broad specificity phosphatase PhoE
MGPFALVVTSDIPRTMETALAMGFAVDEEDPALTVHDPAVHRAVEHFGRGKRLPFVAWAELVGRSTALHEHALRQRTQWLALAARLPEEAAALVISHGGTIEPGVTVCLPSDTWETWGPLMPCEGVRLSVRSGAVVAANVIRL